MCAELHLKIHLPVCTYLRRPNGQRIYWASVLHLSLHHIEFKRLLSCKYDRMDIGSRNVVVNWVVRYCVHSVQSGCRRANQSTLHTKLIDVPEFYPEWWTRHVICARWDCALYVQLLQQIGDEWMVNDLLWKVLSLAVNHLFACAE